MCGSQGREGIHYRIRAQYRRLACGARTYAAGRGAAAVEALGRRLRPGANFDAHNHETKTTFS
jgi:hypothetical protein